MRCMPWAWARAYVCLERGEALHPTLAYANALGTVPLVVAGPGVCAAVDHGLPQPPESVAARVPGLLAGNAVVLLATVGPDP